MKRIDEDGQWTMFCPSEAPQLADLYGDEFEQEYHLLEAGGMGKTSMKARDLWREILLSQIETGGPFIMFKDSVNSKFAVRITSQNLNIFKRRAMNGR